MEKILWMTRFFDQIHDVDLKTMESSYRLCHECHCTACAAGCKNGFEPVQACPLFMIELNNGPDKPHRKCARIVGDTMSIPSARRQLNLRALVNMAQDWSFRYPLVDGHGNSVPSMVTLLRCDTPNGDFPRFPWKCLRTSEKDTVDFVPNFDETEKEPTVLRPVFRTCWSTVRPVSQSVWRQIFRRTICAGH